MQSHAAKSLCGAILGFKTIKTPLSYLGCFHKSRARGASVRQAQIHIDYDVPPLSNVIYGNKVFRESEFYILSRA